MHEFDTTWNMTHVSCVMIEQPLSSYSFLWACSEKCVNKDTLLLVVIWHVELCHVDMLQVGGAC